MLPVDGLLTRVGSVVGSTLGGWIGSTLGGRCECRVVIDTVEPGARPLIELLTGQLKRCGAAQVSCPLPAPCPACTPVAELVLLALVVG
eukprot:12333071-Heterocapsa_arctica.AAC.1